MSNIKKNVIKSNIIRAVIALVILVLTIGASVCAVGYTKDFAYSKMDKLAERTKPVIEMIDRTNGTRRRK